MRRLPSIALLFAIGCGEVGPEAIMSLGGDVRAVPWPSDALLDGKLAVRTPFPFDSANLENHERLAMTLSEDDGFGTTSSIFFPVASDVTVEDGAFAEILDLDDGSVIQKFPLLYRKDTKQLVAVAPAGTVLKEAHRYGCVIDRGVGLHPSPAMRDAMNGRGPVGKKPSYQALARALSKRGPTPLAATAFTTHSLTSWVAPTLAALDAMPPRATVTRVFSGAELETLFGGPATTTRPGWPPSGGVRRDHVAFVIEGTFDSPNFLADAPGQLGLFADSPRSTEAIPYLLILPQRSNFAGTPVVIFQHGIGGDRSAMLLTAESYTARGFAVLGIDELFHGSRFPDAVDESNNLTAKAPPDGIGDPTGMAITLFFNFVGDASRDIDALDLRYMRDAFRQATVDLMQLVRFAKRGDFSTVAAAHPSLAGLTLDGSRLVYTGESFGSILGAQVLAIDPMLEAAVFDVGGGGFLLDLVGNSATFAQLLQPFVAGGFDLLVDVNHPVDNPVRAQMSLNLFQQIIERGDGLPLAGAAGAQKSVLFLEAYNDEVVANHGTEALAAAWGVKQVRVPGDAPTRVVNFPSVNAAYSANPLRALVQLQPAGHGMFTRQRDERRWEDGFPPFVKRAAPVEIENPIEAAHALAIGFMESFRAGSPTVTAP